MRRIALSASLALLMITAAVPAASADDTGTGGTSTTTAVQSAESAPAASTAVSPTKPVPLTRSQTKQVQRKVKVRADGALGSRTRTALKRYQKQKTLTPTGRPNLETLKTMRLSFATKIEQKLLSSPLQSAATPATLAAAITAIQTQIGTPYRSAGQNPGGFDCSGLMVWGFEQAGIDLPRTSFDQFTEGVAVERAAIQPGDLVFFSTAGSGASHVGIATSATTVISATTSGVKEHQLDDSYWGSAYVGARRLSTV